MMPGKIKTLIVAQRPSDFTEMIRAAHMLAENDFEVHFLYHDLTEDMRYDLPVHEKMETEKAAGVIFDYQIIPAGKFLHEAESFQGEKTQGGLKEINFLLKYIVKFSLFKKMTNAIRFILMHILKYFVIPNYYLKAYNYYFNYIKEHSLNVILLPEDVVGAVCPVLIKAGHDNNVPSCILPYTICNQQEAFRTLSHHKSNMLINLNNMICGRLFPKWRMRYKNLTLLRLPAPHIVAHRSLKISPPDPWMMNSGYANVICIESKAMEDYYLQSGIPKSKIEVVGALSDDILGAFLQDKDEEKKKLRAELGLKSDKPIFLIGGFPNQIKNCPYCEFSTVEEIVAFLAECIKPLMQDFEVVVRPHPNFIELADHFQRNGICATSDIDTARLCAVSDLYMAFASATIRWSIGCAVPTINYDVFHYDYDDFDNVQGVLPARKKSELQQIVKRLHEEPSFFDEVRQGVLAESNYWAMMDNQSGQRIAGVIRRLSELEEVPRTTS